MFVSDAKQVLKISFAFWLAVFGVLSMVGPEIWFAYTGRDISPFIRWLVPVLTFVAIAVLRLVQQPGGALRNWIKLIGLMIALVAVGVFVGVTTARADSRSDLQAQTVQIATPFIAQWEGFRSCAYIPIKGDVPTIGYGSTRGVRMGDCITRAQAEALLAREVREYMVNFNAQMPQDAWSHLTPYSNAAFTDLSFNVGWTGAARSTAARRMASGNVDGACYALTWWNRSGGRVVQGLVNRRSDAQRLCLGQT